MAKRDTSTPSAKSPGRKRSDEKSKSAPKPLPSWPEFIRTESQHDIKQRFSAEADEIIAKHPELEEKYCFLFLMNSGSQISAFDLDQIFNVLPQINPDKEKSILLTLLSNGGTIESAYQISKLCKSFTKQNFAVTIPRQAKSAATLLSLGADEIHMGTLGHLGPIDPQLGGLPALGVSQALRTLAMWAEEYPGSADMFARYLRMALTVEQIGYCERISESAVQYAIRLIGSKPKMARDPEKIAADLVYEYKHHGFVIDLEEAQNHLSSEWVTSNTPEVEFAEEIYRLYDYVSLFLGFAKSQFIWWVGSTKDTILIMDSEK